MEEFEFDFTKEEFFKYLSKCYGVEEVNEDTLTIIAGNSEIQIDDDFITIEMLDINCHLMLSLDQFFIESEWEEDDGSEWFNLQSLEANICFTLPKE